MADVSNEFKALLNQHETMYGDQWRHNPARQAILDYVARLEARIASITQAFDSYCYDGLELRGFIHLSADSSEKESETFDALYKAIKGDVP